MWLYEDPEERIRFGLDRLLPRDLTTLPDDPQANISPTAAIKAVPLTIVVALLLIVLPFLAVYVSALPSRPWIRRSDREPARSSEKMLHAARLGSGRWGKITHALARGWALARAFPACTMLCSQGLVVAKPGFHLWEWVMATWK